MKKTTIYNFSQFDDSEKYRKQMIQIGMNIKNIRVKRKMSQMTAAEIAGISDNFWGSVERGRQMPSSVVILKIADALQVPVCELVHANHCPFTKNKYLKKIREIFTGRQDIEKQKITRVIETFFEE